MKYKTLKLLSISLMLALTSFIPVRVQTALENFTLQECIQISLSNHPDIAVARANLKEKIGEENKAKSNAYPSILGSGAYTYINPTLVAVFGPFTIPIDTANSFSTGVLARYSIYNGGRVGNSVKAAMLAVSSGRYALQEARLEKVLNVKIAFYKVLLSLEEVRAARWFLNEAEFNLATSEQLYKTGAAQRLIFLNSIIRKRDAEESFTTANEAYQVNLDNLAVAIGLKSGAVSGVSGNLEEPVLPNFEGLLEKAYQNSPKIMEDEAEIKKQKVNVRLAQATDDPDVSLFAGSSLFTRPFIPFVSAYQNQAGVEVTWPFEFGDRQAQTEESSAKLDEARAKLTGDKHDISFQLTSAYQDAVVAGKKIKAYGKSVAESRISFEDAIAAFANGYISSAQFDETEDLSNQSQMKFLQALDDYEESLARISFLIGENY